MNIELKQPMTPIACNELPHGDEWGYQLKWDGVRILADIHYADRSIQLYSRQLLNKTAVYPEIVRMLDSTLMTQQTSGGLVLDGEAVVFDPDKQRPVFQLALQRERSAGSSQIQKRYPVTYVLFDLLYMNGEDLRELPYSERHDQLKQLMPERLPQLFVSDLFSDGKLLWDWVQQQGWEGVVAKRLTSPYREGKKHADWFKKKTAIELDVSIFGLTVRGGYVASMLMRYEQAFIGKVSLGLNSEDKAHLMRYAERYGDGTNPFDKLPTELKKDKIVWLTKPFLCRVTGLELTSAGLLRHPKIVHFTLPDL